VPVTTDLARVRLLTGATTADVDDDGVQAFLDQENGAVKLAAADVLELMAGQLTDVESDDIKLSGSKQAATLLARAKSLREQHYLYDDGALIVVCGPRS
jgi:hypothetical protein